MQCSELERFLLGNMTVDERIAFADHLAGCPRCCAAMAGAYENAGNPLLSPLPPQPNPPRGITERITRELYLKRRQEFRVYTIQVVLSTCAAIMLIFAGGGKAMDFRDMVEARSISWQESWNSNYNNKSFTDLYTEVFQRYADTKK